MSVMREEQCLFVYLMYTCCQHKKYRTLANLSELYYVNFARLSICHLLHFPIISKISNDASPCVLLLRESNHLARLAQPPHHGLCSYDGLNAVNSDEGCLDSSELSDNNGERLRLPQPFWILRLLRCLVPRPFAQHHMCEQQPDALVHIPLRNEHEAYKESGVKDCFRSPILVHIERKGHDGTYLGVCYRAIEPH